MNIPSLGQYGKYNYGSKSLKPKDTELFNQTTQPEPRALASKELLYAIKARSEEFAQRLKKIINS